MAFARFMASGAGRGVRIIAGVVLVALGLWAVEGTGSTLLALVGLVPLLAGIFDVCLFAPLVGAPLQGEAIRQRNKV